MNITFENISKNQPIKLEINNTSYVIKPENSVEIATTDSKAIFTAELLPVDFSDAFGEDFEPKGLKERFLYKASKKFTEKVPDMMLNTAVTYEFTNNYNNAIVELSDAEYSVADGDIADFFDMMPIAFSFPRAESNFGELKVNDTSITNRKRFLKLYRTSQLMLDYLFFIEIYALAKIYSSDVYTKRLISKLYSVSSAERTKMFQDKLEQLEKEETTKHGCLSGLLKVALVILVLGGLAYWAMSSEPEVIISEDFSQIVYFDETFELYDGSVPDDAKEAFLEDFSAERQLANGEFENDNGYHCYIYEDSDGNRYMWLKEDWYNKFERHKTYEDYDNPKIYKSVNE